MTVESTATKSQIYVADGVTATYDRPFRVTSGDHVTAYLTADGVTSIVAGSTMVHTGISADTGDSTLPSVPAAGVEVILLREVPVLQATVYPAQAAVRPEQFEEDIDELTLISQDARERSDRSLKVHVGSTVSPIINIAPLETFRMNATGTGFEGIPDPSISAASAAASASGAAGSQTAAEASSQTAAGSQTAAEASSQTAAGSQTAAEASAVAAAASAVAAAQSVPGTFTSEDEAKLDYVSVTQDVDLDQMETDIAALANGMVYKDTWDASAGSFPGSGLAKIGWFYYVSVGGTVDSVAFSAGDNLVAIVNDSSSTVYAANWSKHDQTAAVQTVAGRVGLVTLALADITDAGDAAGLDEATTANFRANVPDKLLSTDQVWLAAAEVSLTDAASIAVDFSTGLNFGVTIADNRTLANPTNTKEGQSGRIRIRQDGTGSRELAFGTSYTFPGGTAPTMTTAADAEDFLFYDVISSTRVLIVAALDVA
jgi:biotin carboxyl carrier protein